MLFNKKNAYCRDFQPFSCPEGLSEASVKPGTGVEKRALHKTRARPRRCADVPVYECGM